MAPRHKLALIIAPENWSCFTKLTAILTRRYAAAASVLVSIRIGTLVHVGARKRILVTVMARLGEWPTHRTVVVSRSVTVDAACSPATLPLGGLARFVVD